jgi:hypothetical protein
MGKIFFYCVFLLIVLFLAYLLLRYLYGKDYKKWEPLVFVKNLTFRSLLFPGKKVDQEKKNDYDSKSIGRK